MTIAHYKLFKNGKMIFKCYICDGQMIVNKEVAEKYIEDFNRKMKELEDNTN